MKRLSDFAAYVFASLMTVALILTIGGATFLLCWAVSR